MALRKILLVCVLLVAVPTGSRGVEVVELVPEDRASWRLLNMFAFLRPGHYFGQRTLAVQTTPPGAWLDLYYIRAGFQKHYLQAQAPATIVLPRRIEAGPRDVVRIRALADGYRQEDVAISVLSGQDQVLLELDTLPNTLRAVGHTYLVGRTSLALFTDEAPEVRVTQNENGFSVILNQTARAPGLGSHLDAIRDPLIASVDAQQVGEDLIVRLAFSERAGSEALDLRSRQTHDPIRGLYRYAVDLVPPDLGAEAVQRTLHALEQLGPFDVDGCAARFDAALREALDRAALSRALAPRGEFTDPYLRAAMKRLGEISPGGRIALEDGTRLRPDAPIELAAAVSESWQALGYLALLRALVARLEPPDQRRVVLQGLIAPELDGAAFGALLAQAEEAERRCR